MNKSTLLVVYFTRHSNEVCLIKFKKFQLHALWIYHLIGCFPPLLPENQTYHCIQFTKITIDKHKPSMIIMPSSINIIK